MKNSKQDIENAILSIAKELFNDQIIYKTLINDHVESLPELIKIIIFDMFTNEFNYSNCSITLFQNYKLILEYSKKLKINGYVKFSKNENK